MGSFGRVLLLGDLMLDISCDAEDLLVDAEVEGDLAIAPGGQPFVVAAWLAQTGVRPIVVGALSTRASGVLFRELASEYGVELAPQMFSREQGMVLLVRHRDGRASKIAHAGVSRCLNRDAIGVGSMDGVDAVYVSGYALGRGSSREAAVAVCELANRRGVPIFVDLGSRLVSQELAPDSWRSLLRSVGPSVIFATAGEIDAILPDENALLAAAPVVIVKHGRDGLDALQRDRKSHHAAITVDVADASGCGDALAAAFIATSIAGHHVDAAARAGVESASRCATIAGALPELHHVVS
jgi:sugar/nucleoside kinase (ribokinase family)